MNYKKITFLVLLVVILAAITIIGTSQYKAQKTEENEVVVNEKLVQIVLYFPKKDNSGLEKEYREVSLKEVNQNSPKVILEELIKGPSYEELKASIPSNTKINQIEIDNSMITIDFSKEFEENVIEGEEEQIITSIVNSITEIKEIEKVKIKIDGKEKDVYHGIYKINEVFERTI